MTYTTSVTIGITAASSPSLPYSKPAPPTLATDTTKTVAVLGGSYGGYQAARTLMQHLPPDWRVVLIEANSHMHHVYVFPRYTILAGHAHKAFIPYDDNMRCAASSGGHHTVIRGVVTQLEPRRVHVKTTDGLQAIDFDYAVYALGSAMPEPIRVIGADGDTLESVGKRDGIAWMRERAALFANVHHVAVVGGGALGIQYAADLKEVYPDKEVTLLHSRSTVLPLYPGAHEAVMAKLHKFGVRVILGERVVSWPSETMGLLANERRRELVTDKGTTLSPDIILRCTGQQPNSSVMDALAPKAVGPNGRVLVQPTLQVACSCSERIFAVGDCAETGAIQAGHIAAGQGQLAARNIVALAKGASAAELQTYLPSPPGIKLTLGLHHYLFAGEGRADLKNNSEVDLGAEYMWKAYGASLEGEARSVDVVA